MSSGDHNNKSVDVLLYLLHMYAEVEYFMAHCLDRSNIRDMSQHSGRKNKRY